MEQSWSGVSWHIVFYGVEFGAVLEWCGLAHCILWGRVWSSHGVCGLAHCILWGLAHCILWGRVWSSVGVVWVGTLYSMR